jgi:hypothetical protein
MIVAVKEDSIYSALLFKGDLKVINNNNNININNNTRKSRN